MRNESTVLFGVLTVWGAAMCAAACVAGSLDPPLADATMDLAPDVAAGLALGAVCVDNNDCAVGHCGNNLCCAPGETCCASDGACANLRGCNLLAFQCFDRCDGVNLVDHAKCAAQAHCELDVGCVENQATGECTSDSGCLSGSCITDGGQPVGRCCEHTGLCCFADSDCPAMFSSCDVPNRTCKFFANFIGTTGQVACYSGISELNCSAIQVGSPDYGQDGHYAVARTYVTTNPGVVGDSTTKLEWAVEHSTTEITYSDAASYCTSLSALDGGGWRVPTRYELQSLVDYSIKTNRMFGGEFDDSGSANSKYWSTTGVTEQPTLRWVVDFNSGVVVEHIMGETAFVRCVRAGIGL